MIDRRHFLGALGLPAVAFAQGCASVDPSRAHQALAAAAANDPRSPEEIAQDETFWRPVQNAFSVDRSMVNLNNGGVSPSPTIVHERYVQHLGWSNLAPSFHMWREQEPGREGVRQKLASVLGCDAEEVAITRNASESLITCQHGFDLKAGDEVVTSNQDYPRMRQAFAQRARRDGIVVKEISLPPPSAEQSEVVAAFAAAMTPRTRLLLCCHVINLTGRILPVRDIVAMARAKGVPTIVDGAHAFAHFPFRIADLDCDYYGVSLHKWTFAPVGTGLLYVRKSKIPTLWPLMAADPRQDGDIRKFEEIGTHPAGNVLATGDAVIFHLTLGPERKAARLRYLRDRWARRLEQHDKVVFFTDLRPERSCGIANVAIRGVDSGKLGEHLWNKHRILVTPIDHPDCNGMRITPSIYTTLEEIDLFSTAMETVIAGGLPAPARPANGG